VKKRVAIYYEDHRRVGRNDGAPLYVWNILNKNQDFEVQHLIPDARRLKDWGNFDLNLWVDWGEDALKNILDYEPIKCPKPSVYWVSDTHLGYEYRRNKAREFDHVFCMQKRAVEDFAKDGISAEWLPHAFEPQAYPRRTMIKKYDTCFIGHVNSKHRISFLDEMFKAFPNFFFGNRIFESAAEIYCQSKIVLNISIKDDLNMRVFETLGTGSFLLTNEIPTLGEFFKDGVHLATYKTTEEAIDKAKYYINNDDARERIAKAGYEEAISKHTYAHRVARILEKTNLKVEASCL